MAYRRTNKITPPDYTYIPGGLNIGCQIVIRGRVGFDSDRFSINLMNDQDWDQDIAFHFNPRIDDESVVRNSFSGGWQDEERDIPFFPFSSGAKFTLRIFCGPNEFFVLVNGRDFVHFNHRLSYEAVRYLNLGEGAEYYECTIQNRCRVPFKGEFPGGLKMGKALRVRGFIEENAEQFAINFNCDCDGETVGIHFNPRQSEDIVVMNSKVGDWGDEERDQDWFPFKRGEMFDVLFIAYDGKFMIYSNEKFFTSYDFRVPSDDICHLEIKGDVVLMDVEFTEPLDDDFVKEIPSGLEKSDMVVAKGFFFPEGNRFSLNLMYGDSKDHDVALHFNPRRDDDCVVYNSREGGSWEEEERQGLPTCFEQLLPFTVEIVVKGKKFKIYVNGKKQESFKARGNVEDIKGINVGGDVYMYELKVLKRCDRPFVDKLPGNIEVGSWVSLVGTPKKNADTFSINLQCGDSTECEDDIAFHFNPRFDGEDSVRNSKEGGDWGDEERDQPHFPFEPEDRFLIDILRLDNEFKVFINQKHYIDFAHRIDADRICHLMMTGACNFFEPEYY